MTTTPRRAPVASRDWVAVAWLWAAFLVIVDAWLVVLRVVGVL